METDFGIRTTVAQDVTNSLFIHCLTFGVFPYPDLKENFIAIPRIFFTSKCMHMLDYTTGYDGLRNGILSRTIMRVIAFVSWNFIVDRDASIHCTVFVVRVALVVFLSATRFREKRIYRRRLPWGIFYR